MEDELGVVHVESSGDVATDPVLLGVLAWRVAAAEEDVQGGALFSLHVHLGLGFEAGDAVAALLDAAGMKDDHTTEERQLVNVAEEDCDT